LSQNSVFLVVSRGVQSVFSEVKRISWSWETLYYTVALLLKAL